MAYGPPYSVWNSRYYYGFYGPHAGATPRSDEELAADIRNRLTWDSWVNAEQVNIRVEGAVVTLEGDADSIVEKRAAGDDAWDTPGVRDVVNNLKVRQPVR